MRKKIDDGGFETPYRLRKQVVEPVFGQIKQARGFRQFLLRGVKKVRAEWAMICNTHSPKTFHPRKGRLRQATVQQMPRRHAYLDGLLARPPHFLTMKLLPELILPVEVSSRSARDASLVTFNRAARQQPNEKNDWNRDTD
jgi:Transposase DDE domain